MVSMRQMVEIVATGRTQLQKEVTSGNYKAMYVFLTKEFILINDTIPIFYYPKFRRTVPIH